MGARELDQIEHIADVVSLHIDGKLFRKRFVHLRFEPEGQHTGDDMHWVGVRERLLGILASARDEHGYKVNFYIPEMANGIGRVNDDNRFADAEMVARCLVEHGLYTEIHGNTRYDFTLQRVLATSLIIEEEHMSMGPANIEVMEEVWRTEDAVPIAEAEGF